MINNDQLYHIVQKVFMCEVDIHILECTVYNVFIGATSKSSFEALFYRSCVGDRIGQRLSRGALRSQFSAPPLQNCEGLICVAYVSFAQFCEAFILLDLNGFE